jgi:hypothetical protein
MLKQNGIQKKDVYKPPKANRKRSSDENYSNEL